MTAINIRIPDDLHKQLRLEAIQQETTLKELVIRLLGGDS